MDAATMLLDVGRQIAAHAFTGVCVFLFAASIRCGTACRSLRALSAVAMSTVLLGVQPLLYASPTQPVSIGLASLAMMAAWTFLDIGLLQLAPPTTVNGVYYSWFMHTMDGVLNVHKRRSSTHKPKADDPQPVFITAAVETDQGSIKKRSPAAGRPIIHIEAVAGPAADGSITTTTPSCGAAPAADLVTVPHPAPLASHASGEGLSSDFDEATTKLTAELTLGLDALLVIVKLVVTYDVGFALLCCCSGCMCSGTPAAAVQASISQQGLLGALLGPVLARYAFSFAAGMLLPMQMGLAYACIRLAVLLLGNTQLAESLPADAFNAPLMATSITDLWSNRWHQFLRYYFQGLGHKLVDVTVRPVCERLLPLAWHKQALLAARVLVVFAMSGVLHEYLTLAAFGAVTGKYMAFFMLHGLVVLAEAFAARLLPGVAGRMPGWVGRVWAVGFMVLTGPLFTEPYQQFGYFKHCYHPLLWPVTATVARRAGLCGCGY